MSNLNIEEVVKSFDRSLTLVKPYTDFVYHVEKKGKPYILKVDSNNSLFICHEVDVLNNLNNVSCVTHLVKDYGLRGKARGILKEYAQGKEIYCFDEVLRLVKKKLFQTVHILHQLGFADLDLNGGGIIVNDKDAKIIDFDQVAVRRKYVADLVWDEAIRNDFYTLNKLCGSY